MSDKQNTHQELLSFIAEARRFMQSIENPEWIGSAALTDEEHISEMKAQLEASRNVHTLPEKTEMHSVRAHNTGLVYAYTGNTPLAAQRARFLTGLLMALPRLLEGIEASMIRESFMDARIKELIESNNEKLFENRAQRQNVRQLQAQVDHLLKTIPVEPETVEVKAKEVST